MEERWTYDQIRWTNFLSMYGVRRNIVWDKRKWGNSLEDIGVACGDLQIEDLSDLHSLMVCTIYLILCAGLSPKPGLDITTNAITSILTRTPIDDLLRDVPEDEAREVRIDLEILGFIPPDVTKPKYT